MVPAFGRAERMGEDKLWATVGVGPLIALTLQRLGAPRCFDFVVVAAPRARHQALQAHAAAAGLADLRMVEGGSRRQDSVAACLARCDGADIVCVHDAARPMAPPELFPAVIAAARRAGAAITAIPCVDTIKQVSHHNVVATLDRAQLVAVQTPQAFELALLRRAHERARADGVSAEDDSALVERLGTIVAAVPGDPRNLKVTTPFDLEVLRATVAGVAR